MEDRGVNIDEEQEDMNRKEEELEAELNIATKRCEELKRTLKETKSFLDARGVSLRKDSIPKPRSSIHEAVSILSVDTFDEEDDTFEEEDEDEDSDDEVHIF